MEPEKSSSVIPSIQNIPGSSLQECLASTDWPLTIQASWLERSIKISLKLINRPSSLFRIAGAAIQEGDGVNMTVKEISITMRRPRSLAMNSQGMILYWMGIIPHSVWGMTNTGLHGTKAVSVRRIVSYVI